MDQLRRRGPMFKCGDAVEVCFFEEGLRGAWFEARVAGVQRRRDRPSHYRYGVVFDAFVSEDGRGSPLRSHVPSSRIRPRPPLPGAADTAAGLVLGGCVDAMWREAWWTGVVTRVPPDTPVEGEEEEEEGRYSLYFEASNEAMDFRAGELRPHLNWIDGNWVAPAVQDNLANSKAPCGTMFIDHKKRLRAIDSITVSNDHPPEILSISGSLIEHSISDASKENSAFMLKRKSPCQQMLDLPNSEKKQKKDKIPDGSSLSDFITNEKIITEKFEKELDNTTETVVGSPHLKPCIVDKPLEDINKQTQESKVEHSVLLEQKKNDNVSSNSNGGSLCQDTNTLLSETSNTEDRIESQCLKYDNQNNLINNDCLLKKVECSQGARMEDSASKFQGWNAWMQLTVDKSSRKEKKPLEHEKPIQELHENLIQEREIHVDTCIKEMVTDGTIDKEVVPCKITSLEISNNITQPACFPECEPPNERIVPPHQTESCCVALEIPTSISTNKSPDQDGDRLCFMHASEQNNLSSLGASEKETFSDTAMIPINTSHERESGAVDEKSVPEIRGLNLENCSLFTKSFHLWSAIDSMEVFSKFPQYPHFRPLEEQPEMYREGLAIGLTITFSTAIEKLKNLPISGSDVTLKYSMKTLVQLEEHGFDIQDVVGLIEKLLGLKESRDQLLSKSKVTRNLIHEKQNEVEKFSVEEEINDKSISDMLKSLALAHEKKDRITQQLAGCAYGMEKLESSSKEIEDKLAMMESKFEDAISHTF